MAGVNNFRLCSRACPTCIFQLVFRAERVYHSVRRCSIDTENPDVASVSLNQNALTSERFAVCERAARRRFRWNLETCGPSEKPLDECALLDGVAANSPCLVAGLASVCLHRARGHCSEVIKVVVRRLIQVSSAN